MLWVRVPHPALVLTVARERATVGTNKRKTELNSGKRSSFPRFRRVAQFGSALRSGRRGRRFKSCYADRGAEATEGARGCGCCHAGVCGGIGGALGVCGWRLCVCARVLSVLVSKLGPVWVGRLRVSAHAGWAGRWCGWCACVPLVGRTVVAWLSLVFVSAPLLFCLRGGIGRHTTLKMWRSCERVGSSPTGGTGTTQNA